MAKTTSSSALVVWASASNFLLGIVQRDSTSTILGVYGVWVFLSCYFIFYLGLKFGWEGKGLGECACACAREIGRMMDLTLLESFLLPVVECIFLFDWKNFFD